LLKTIAAIIMAILSGYNREGGEKKNSAKFRRARPPFLWKRETIRGPSGLKQGLHGPGPVIRMRKVGAAYFYLGPERELGNRHERFFYEDNPGASFSRSVLPFSPLRLFPF
jgi:hypothetical protein